MPKINLQRTELVTSVGSPGVLGVEICKAINFLMFNTYVKFYIDVGGNRIRVLRLVPFGNGKDITVSMEGNYSLKVPWNTRFEFFLGGNFHEYSYGIREGGIFPTRKDAAV